VSSSSSPRMASWRCRGVIRFTRRSLEAFPNDRRRKVSRELELGIQAMSYQPTLTLRQWGTQGWRKCIQQPSHQCGRYVASAVSGNDGYDQLGTSAGVR
jgi:hypothetical protein